MTKAFLLGAGATKAQYPSTPINKDFFSYLRSQKEDLYMSIENAIHSKKELEKRDLEDVMSEVEQYPESNQQLIKEALFNGLYILLGELTNSTEKYMDDYRLNLLKPQPQTIFKNLIINQKLNEKDFFMTLNYDLCLDMEIYKELGMVDYGINEFVEEKRASKNGFSMPSLNVGHLMPLLDEQQFSIYHLHGALNWEIVGDSVKVHIGAIKPNYSRQGVNLLLAPPGTKKLHPVLKTIWSTAEKRLLSANELIIIGCSLNPNDVELCHLMKKFQSERGVDKIKIIYLGDRGKKSVSENYTNLVGNGFKSYPYGFVIRGPRPDIKGAIEFIFN